MHSVRLQRAVASFLAVTFVLPAQVLAQDTPPPAPVAPAPVTTPAPEAAPEMSVKDGAIEGRLLALDGKTAIQGRKVTLRNADTADVIATVTTAEDGAFKLPKLVNGVYLVECDGLVYPIEVRDDQPLRNLKVLVPGERSGLGRVADDTASTLLWVGAGAAVLILAGVGGGVIGYNLRHTTGGRRGGVGTPQNPLVFEVAPSGDYGFVTINTSSQRTFILRNQSNTDLSGNLSSTSSQFVIVSGDTFTLAPGGTAAVTVRFSPTVAASHIGTIEAVITSPPGLGLGTASKGVFGVGTLTAVSPVGP